MTINPTLVQLRKRAKRAHIPQWYKMPKAKLLAKLGLPKALKKTSRKPRKYAPKSRLQPKPRKPTVIGRSSEFIKKMNQQRRRLETRRALLPSLLGPSRRLLMNPSAQTAVF